MRHTRESSWARRGRCSVAGEKREKEGNPALCRCRARADTVATGLDKVLTTLKTQGLPSFKAELPWVDVPLP